MLKQGRQYAWKTREIHSFVYQLFAVVPNQLNCYTGYSVWFSRDDSFFTIYYFEKKILSVSIEEKSVKVVRSILCSNEIYNRQSPSHILVFGAAIFQRFQESER